MATWQDVRRFALALPGGTRETQSYGNMAWTVNNKVFVWERPLRKSDLAALADAAPSGPVVGIRTADLEMKEALLRSDPRIFFTTPHFDGYPVVLVPLQTISRSALKAVIIEAWLARAPKRAVDDYLGANVKRSVPQRRVHPIREPS